MADDPVDELALRRARKNRMEFSEDIAERLRALGIAGGTPAADVEAAIRKFAWTPVPDARIHPNCRCTAVYLEEPKPVGTWWQRAIAWVRTRRIIWRLDRWAKKNGLARRRRRPRG